MSATILYTVSAHCNGERTDSVHCRSKQYLNMQVQYTSCTYGFSVLSVMHWSYTPNVQNWAADALSARVQWTEGAQAVHFCAKHWGWLQFVGIAMYCWHKKLRSATYMLHRNFPLWALSARMSTDSESRRHADTDGEYPCSFYWIICNLADDSLMLRWGCFSNELLIVVML